MPCDFLRLEEEEEEGRLMEMEEREKSFAGKFAGDGEGLAVGVEERENIWS